MEGRITLLSLFLIGNLVAAFLYFQFGLEKGALLFSDRPSVPLVVLSFGPSIQILVLWLVKSYLEIVSPLNRLFPRLIIANLEDDEFTLIWEKFSAFFVLGLPVVAFGWAWHKFLTKGNVWHVTSGNVINPFDFATPQLFFGGWDLHRYGNQYSNEGASIVPFWQPVFIMAGGCLVVFLLTTQVLINIWKRLPVRQRSEKH